MLTALLPPKLSAKQVSRTRATRPALLKARRFTHPGTPTLPRLISVETPTTRDVLLRLAPGCNVGQVLSRYVDTQNIWSGCGRVLSGGTRRLQYHVIIQAEKGNKPYVYGGPITIDMPATWVAATLTIGRSVDGAPLLHCHGGFAVGNESLGGHFALNDTIVGDEGMTVALTIFDGVDMVVTDDSETNYAILSPRLRSASMPIPAVSAQRAHS
jgi:hypothetical protein